MINGKIKLFLITIIFLCVIRLFLMMFLDDNTYYEQKQSVTGIITNIKKESGKTTFDLKDKVKYRVTTTNSFDYKLGDRVMIYGKVYTPFNNTVFNLFNYRKYLLSKNIKFVIDPSSIKLIKSNNNVIYKIKNIIIKRIEKFNSSAYLKALILGDQSEIKEEIKDVYEKTGTSHLFAISGSNVMAIVLVLNFILKKIRFKNVLIFLFLLFFLFLTNYTESLMRALLFLFFRHVNKKLKLNYSTSFVLLMTGVFLLLYNPYLIYNVGFLFSIIISFFIVLIAPKLKGKNYLVKLIYISLISFLASIPIIACTFFKINLLSPLFNLVLVPMVSLVIFPVGIITFFIPVLDNLFFSLISLLELISTLFSKISFSYVTIAKPSYILVLIYYVLLYVTIVFKRKSFLLIFAINFLLNINLRFFINKPEVLFMDVGQGDCAIIILPTGKAVVIDTGGTYYSTSSIAKNKIIPYLNSRGISKIESLILTHGDNDHMGNAIYLVNNFNVKQVVFNNGEYNDLELKLIEVLKEKNISYYQNIEELNIGNNMFYFLNDELHDDENDSSNVIYTELSGYNFMFMGDASSTTEKEIIDKYNLPDIDILKVGHHGSRTSSSIEFINEINPEYSIISVGKNNRYGHPNKEVLDALEESKIYRTDQNGSIMFKINNNKLKIETCSP